MPTTECARVTAGRGTVWIIICYGFYRQSRCRYGNILLRNNVEPSSDGFNDKPSNTRGRPAGLNSRRGGLFILTSPTPQVHPETKRDRKHPLPLRGVTRSVW